MTKKQEKIKEAYGQYWESGNIDENGWTNSVSQGFLHEIPCDGKEMHIVYGHPEWWYRPKSLAGLEDNNGWISIESEADLPKESDDLFEVGLLDGIGCFHHERKRCAGKSVKYMWDKGLITHYQPIVKPKPPIY